MSVVVGLLLGADLSGFCAFSKQVLAFWSMQLTMSALIMSVSLVLNYSVPMDTGSVRGCMLKSVCEFLAFFRFFRDIELFYRTIIVN